MDRGLVVIRGGGDIATGIACRLINCGFRVIILEIEKPTVVRHTVAFAQCVYSQRVEVEGITAIRVETPVQAREKARFGVVPVLVDPEGLSIKELQPDIVVDAIMAKGNRGTTIDMAPLVIAAGPGFVAGVDAHAVIETQRGHHLGRVYYQGKAIANTGCPGEINGKSAERLVRAPVAGIFKPEKAIGERVQAGERLGRIESTPVLSPLTGVLRGLINEGVTVFQGMKIGDVDPRQEIEYCWSVSDKARAVGGGVLEAILALQHRAKTS